MKRSAYIESLDGLRGIAAMAVVISHMGLLLKLDLPQLLVGDQAVALFFALSGFLMAYLYGDKPFNAQTVADYAVNRMARIYPVYLTAVVLVIHLSFIPGFDYIQPIEGPVQIVRHLVMLGSTGVFWSIPPEIQFYGFFLLIWFYLDDPARRRWLLALLVAGFAVLMYLGFPGPGILLPAKLPYFVFGAIAGLVFRSGRVPVAGAAAGIITLLLLLLFFVGSKILPSNEPFWGASSALMATIIVYLAAAEAPVAKTVLGFAPFRFAGQISFSLYLFHMPIGFVVTWVLPDSLPPVLSAVLIITVCIAAATLAHYVIEKPERQTLTARWKARRARQAQNLQPAAP